MTKLSLAGIAIVMLFHWSSANGQIYSQGKNLNNQNIFYLKAELTKKPQDPSRFIVKVDFYGRRRDIDWYLKEGVEHKSFETKEEMIGYLEENGWFYLSSEFIRARSTKVVREQFCFRKSMSQLQKDHEAEVSNKPMKISE